MKKLLLSLSFVLVVAGTTMLALPPSTAESAIYGTKAKISHYVAHITEKTVGDIPHIVLGGEGGQTELDNADNEFIEIIDYREAMSTPVYAAHNGAGGEVILYWEKGQEVQTTGSREGLWEVVDYRVVSKGETTDALVGLEGDIIVQSCFWGTDEMRFVALKKK